MPKVLKRLTIDRIDFVDDGANEGARITLFKRNKETPMADEKTVDQKAEDAPQTVELEKRLKDAEAASVELAKRLKDAEDAAKASGEEVAKMRDRLEREDAIAIAKSVAHVASVDDLAEIVRVAKRAFTPEMYGKFEAVLKGAETRIAKGALFQEFGSAGQDAGATPAEKLDQMVKQEVTKRGGKATYATVYADLTKDNPEAKALYIQTQTEGR